MFLCFMALEREGKVTHELCLVPDKTDPLAMPIKIDDLKSTEGAVFRVGQDEALIVVRDHSDGAMVLIPYKPAFVYLTPNLAQYPGMKAEFVKIISSGDKHYRVYFSRDRQRWDEWTPQRERT